MISEYYIIHMCTWFTIVVFGFVILDKIDKIAEKLGLQ